MIGKTISHYKIIEKLGEGGLGIIYKAEDLKLKRMVALKFLPHEVTRDRIVKERFVGEAQAASVLEHPNICNVHEIDEASIDGRDQMFICMAYYPGETLEQRIERGPLKIDEAIDIAIQISQGLAIAHEAKITHRDIKPANVIITNRAEVKIIDFGTAKLADRKRLTDSGTTLGTLTYMSPEQIQGNHVDRRSDIFAFGAVLHEMVSGQKAFKGELDQVVVYSIVNKDPEPLTALRTGVPKELERIVNKALNKNMEERYQHVDEMLVDLKALRLMVREGSEIRTDSVESLAVMPFSNTSENEELEYLSDGITDTLITNLSQVSNIKVISRTSVFHYKGQQIELQKVAQELTVSKFLLGWVNQRSDDVSIGIELVDGQDNSQIWGEQYTRKLTDMAQIQKEIVKDISTKLKLKLTSKEKKHLSKQYEIDNEAYQLFLKGR